MPLDYSGRMTGPPTEESRAFLQQRLALFAKLAFFLSSGFFLFVAVLGRNPAAPLWISTRPAAYHLAANFILLATWVACARGPAYPLGWIRAREAASITLYCLCMAIPVAGAGQAAATSSTRCSSPSPAS